MRDNTKLMNSPNKLFTYKRHLRTDSDQTTQFIEGEIGFVCSFIPREEFYSLFGGRVLSKDRNDQKYTGVWGLRNTKRFTRILRERGAVFEVVEIPTSERQPLGYTSMQTRDNG